MDGTKSCVVGLAVAVAVALGCAKDEGGAPPPPAPTVAASASASPGATVLAPPEEADAPAAPAWDCGAKGQKPCPMQGWMKGVLAGAVASGDPAAIAAALEHAASKPPPGYAEWTAVAADGAARARAGDLDGAKASCRRCHDLYKQSYVKTMRDRPF
jgi:hypothetical protein